ncbi:hypothetical protein [Parahaliea aestuarii]|uniref:Lipoprotein n=1 Tax=Parahaliea aestuarii TaxID=1852021 RepID=A0A5C8ZNT0_9GAMM|nr:hypothetical protein [Parahaliea aestuarii]TXS89021.1 hypothetical protein FVW59_19035 [Parahaliea aestuarii]
MITPRVPSLLCIVLLAATLLSGCASAGYRDNPLALKPGDVPAADLARYKLIEVGDTFDDAVATTNNYAALYYMTADAIDGITYYSSEVEFYSTAIAAIGGALGSADVAIAATAIAAGTSVWEKRYKRPLRSASYRVAASEMACFHFKLLEIKADANNPGDAAATAIIKKQVNDSRFRLSQRNINLRPIVPDMTALQNAFRAEGNAEKDMSDGQKAGFAATAQAILQKDLLITRLQTCVVPETGASTGPAGPAK